MKKYFTIATLLLSIAGMAQRQKAEAYISNYKELAIAEMIRTGVPASIKLAQGILESQSGESDLAKTSNNHFGIKCKTEWTGAKTYHDDDEKAECFRVYPSVEDSYRDHSDFLRNRPNYASLFLLDPTDYEGWAKGLKKAGYATSPTYPQKLLKVINDYNLQQYSLIALERKKNGTAVTSVAVSEEQKNMAAVEKKQQPSNATATAATQPDNNNTKDYSIKTNHSANQYPQGVFTINHSKVVFVTEGISLLALANQFDISLSKLLEYNDLPEMDLLDTDRLIFIEKKLKKGATDFHLVQPGETLHAISQQEGVRMNSLLEFNRLTKDAHVSEGDKLLLRPASGSSASSTKLPK